MNQQMDPRMLMQLITMLRGQQGGQQPQPQPQPQPQQPMPGGKNAPQPPMG